MKLDSENGLQVYLESLKKILTETKLNLTIIKMKVRILEIMGEEEESIYGSDLKYSTPTNWSIRGKCSGLEKP